MSSSSAPASSAPASRGTSPAPAAVTCSCSSARRTRDSGPRARAWVACARSSPRTSTSGCRSTPSRSTARFEAETGHPAGYRAHGYLLLATSARTVRLPARQPRAPARAGAVYRRSLLTADDVQRMIPQLRIDDVAGATFCPTDGFVDPYSVMNGFTAGSARPRRAAAQAHGGRVNRDGRWTRRRASGRSGGSVDTRHVVLAAGAWAAPLARTAGVRPSGRAAPPHAACRPSRFPGLPRTAADGDRPRHGLPLPARRPGLPAGLGGSGRTALRRTGVRQRVRREAARTGGTASPRLRRSRGEPRERMGRALRDVARQARHPRARARHARAFGWPTASAATASCTPRPPGGSSPTW